jgi:hypothetical protein
MRADRWTIGALVAVLLLVSLLAPSVTAASRGDAAATAGWGWTDRTAPIAPPQGAGTLLAFDSLADRFVFFGGWNATTFNETWEYDPTNGVWTDLHPELSPTSRADATFVFDPGLDEFVLFGGWTEEPNGSVVRLNDTWTFSLGSDAWVELHPRLAPSPRSDSAAAFDLATGEMFLYGGFSGSQYLGDQWTFDPATGNWAPLAELGPGPGVRSDGRMVYDASLNDFLLFGGNDYNGPNLTFHHLNDTWQFSLSADTWTSLDPASAPTARDYAAEGYDPATGDVLLFSGFGNRTILDDTWEFSPTVNSWTELDVAPSPPGRYAGAGTFDPNDNLFLIVGGLGTTGLLNDTWTFAPVPGTGAPTPVVFVAGAASVGAVLAGVLALVIARRRGPRSP